MSLPRVRANLTDAHAVARILRSALRHEIEVVPLESPPNGAGQHLLEVDVPGHGVVMLLADVLSASGSGHQLRLRPLTRAQMAEILAVVERLVDPAPSEPPASDRDPLWELVREPVVDDRTILDRPDAHENGRSVAPAGFGVIDSAIPAPLLSMAPPTPRAHPLIGRVIAGKYEIEALLGEGATAAVFRAMHTDLRRAVAVKILHEHKLDDEQFVRRFKAEAHAASKLEHANIARVIDFGQEKEDDLLYLVMELLAGKSLDSILKTEGKLAQHKAVSLVIQACTGLAYAHDSGIVHRDVKPENLMVVPHRDDDGQPCDLVKVCDFGLAKLRDPEAEHADLTTAGMLCGTPAYMSPEQTRGEVLDGRSDVYSLGVTLFQVLTGELPHEADGLAQFFLKKMLEPPRRPSTLVADIDPLLEDVLLRAIATDPASRHANARVLREELREVLRSLAPPSDARHHVLTSP